ncbi:transposase [Streptomyces sp. NPDC047718]|uniref:IS110 family transposase n=1 Tax=Streptomyces sp. NPDC047718 TaxID=3155479 RepID=UPI0033E50D5B
MARLQDAKDEVIHLRSAGVDLGKRFLLACVRTPSSKRVGSWSLETERFGTTTAEVRRLLAWLVERQVEVVVMEATSDYWRPVYYLLQPHLNLMLVNPAQLKGIRGRKTDPSDAAFLARAGASGMVMASFVPGRDVRELRGLTRRRTELARAAGWEAQRLEKELEDTGMKLSAVLSDVAGATGRAILEALIAGERDPARLADLAIGRARNKIPQLVEALDGDFTSHHAFMVRHYLDEIDRWKSIITLPSTPVSQPCWRIGRAIWRIWSPFPASVVSLQRSSSPRPEATWLSSPQPNASPPGSECVPGRTSRPG